MVTVTAAGRSVAVGAALPLLALLAVAVMASEGGGDHDSGIAIEAELSADKVLVHSQLLYTVRLYRPGTLIHGYLVQPEVAGVVMVQLGGDRESTGMRDGRSHTVTERSYALFPQVSGRLELPGAAFSGRDVFARAEGLAVEVLPPPLPSPGDWLPAKELSLSEEWSVDPEGVAAGEAVVRILTVRARGLTAAHLPPLSPFAVDGLRAWASPPLLRDEVGTDGVTGERVERHTYMLLPGHGAIALPAVGLSWWDTGRERPGLAVLPPRTVGAGLPAAVADPALAPLQPSPAGDGRAVAGSLGEEGVAGVPLWRLLPAVALFAAVALVLALICHLVATPVARWYEITRARRAFAAACAADRPQAAWGALVRWKAVVDGGGLPEAGGSGGEGETALAGLVRARYGPPGSKWDGAACRRELDGLLRRGGLRPERRGPRAPGPPPLNPNG